MFVVFEIYEVKDSPVWDPSGGMSVVRVAKFAIICNLRHNTRVTRFLLLHPERVFILCVNINIRRRQTTTRNSCEFSGKNAVREEIN